MQDENIKNENNNEIENGSVPSEAFEDVSFVESTEDGEPLPTKDVVKKLREDLKICRKEKEEYLTGWQRAKADYINLQKEMESVRLNSGILAKEKMAENLLAALDSFDMAIKDKAHWDKIDKDWQNGITSIHQQILTGLGNSGIEKIDKTEVPFDPNIHESVSIIPTEEKEKDHIVASIFQAGYKIGNKVFRPAKVIIYEYKTE